MYVISNPIVFKNQASEQYIILGKTSIEKISSEMKTQEEHSKATCAHASSSSVVEEDEDETGLDPRDIELVMTQTGLPWTNAAKALKAADNDIVTAIMDHKMKSWRAFNWLFFV